MIILYFLNSQDFFSHLACKSCPKIIKRIGYLFLDYVIVISAQESHVYTVYFFRNIISNPLSKQENTCSIILYKNSSVRSRQMQAFATWQFTSFYLDFPKIFLDLHWSILVHPNHISAMSCFVPSKNWLLD